MNDNKQLFVFPQYRQLKNAGVFYKILNESNFVEIKQMGKKYLKSEIKAIQFPEKLLIQDMLINSDNNYELIDAQTFNTLEKEAITF